MRVVNPLASPAEGTQPDARGWGRGRPGSFNLCTGWKLESGAARRTEAPGDGDLWGHYSGSAWRSRPAAASQSGSGARTRTPRIHASLGGESAGRTVRGVAGWWAPARADSGISESVAVHARATGPERGAEGGTLSVAEPGRTGGRSCGRRGRAAALCPPLLACKWGSDGARGTGFRAGRRGARKCENLCREAQRADRAPRTSERHGGRWPSRACAPRSGPGDRRAGPSAALTPEICFPVSSTGTCQRSWGLNFVPGALSAVVLRREPPHGAVSGRRLGGTEGESDLFLLYGPGPPGKVFKVRGDRSGDLTKRG